MTRGQVAKSVRQDKELRPERYCPDRRCLWKTAEVGPNGEYILNADPCRKHPELNTASSRKDDQPTFCGNRDEGCGAELTEADFENGACTQCSYPLGVSGLPLEHQLLLSLREIQSQRDVEVA